jgi:hypothetical protein
MIKLLMILTWTIGVQTQSTDTVTVFALDRNTHSNIRITEIEIQKSFVDRVDFFDREIYDSLSKIIIDLDANDDSLRRRNVSNLDVRLLIRLKVKNTTRTISIGKFDRIAIDGKLVFDFEIGKIITLLRQHLAPDLHWYIPTQEELNKFKRKSQLRIE